MLWGNGDIYAITCARNEPTLATGRIPWQTLNPPKAQAMLRYMYIQWPRQPPDLSVSSKKASSDFRDSGGAKWSQR